ncbi:replicase polyprotein 1ab [Rhizoctonia solani]|uniref:Replicase polyprotein 1ab n=1 Tax=Rhizoctonia solani TaxID=456999 RepID=A0A8H8SSU5_9AGAM|nr:replicase polyprotein 1ab [Rhizoctonia solani]QRW17156.1 replicase polyprotein 1ab [Rhizoctonia solani]
MEHLYNRESSPVYQYNPDFTITESSENILPQLLFTVQWAAHTIFVLSDDIYAAGKVSNQSNRETNSSETRLSHFHSSLMGFWRNKFSVILKEQNTEKAVLVERLYETQLKQSEPRAISKQVISQVLDELFVLDREMQSSWTTCVREALEQLVKHLDPIVQCALECPTWEPLLTPEINKGNVVYFRNMNNWMDCITSLFESEYDRLEKALKAEVWHTPGIVLSNSVISILFTDRMPLVFGFAITIVQITRDVFEEPEERKKLGP